MRPASGSSDITHFLCIGPATKKICAYIYFLRAVHTAEWMILNFIAKNTHFWLILPPGSRNKGLR